MAEQSKKILVVYYSRTGHMRDVSEAIAARCGADIEVIDDSRNRAGFWAYLRSAREAIKQISIEIRPPVHRPGDYDLVVLGSPVWAGHMCSPMRAYLGAESSQLKCIAICCTEGGSGGDKVIDEIARLCGQAPVAVMRVQDRELGSAGFERKLEQFMISLGAGSV
jgi:flavodoxin